ncbi:MAG: glucuronate isomerase [Cyclobacteriaceae bacterium]|jgi:glucuronate isomerase
MTFITDNFLLQSDTAVQLYFDHAKDQPIIDYHNHLSTKDIAEDRHFETITDGWLEGDHYKWRAMRANGIDESFVTGSAPKIEKFRKWSETVPYTLRNPLYHWTHLELKRYFGVDDLLNTNTADAVFEKSNDVLKSVGCYGLLKQMDVRVACSTDDPIDDLKYHKQIKEQNLDVKVFPTFRPDKSFALDDIVAYNEYLDKLGQVVGSDIKNIDDLVSALNQRMDYFSSLGCKLSDHGINRVPYKSADSAVIESNFKKAREGKHLNPDEIEQIQTYILLELGKGYHKQGWTQQFHLGALRNNNERGLRELGPDTGFDSMGDFSQAETLSNYLNTLDNTNQLAKTVLYNLNSRDNDLLATMAGNFNDGVTPGKIQFGTGWWFLDQKDGMEAQMNSLSNMGLMSRFVGMLTDSRSFLSFPRHEYFRRILCNLLGEDVRKGMIPNDMDLLGKMVEDICYNNAKNYFNFE